MATKKKRGSSPTVREGSDGTPKTKRAPRGRGGVAIGRAVGLPFGGGRPRKRKANAKRVNPKNK